MKYTLELIEGEYQNRDEAISALNLYRWHRRGQPVIVVYHDGDNDRAIFAIGVKSSNLQSSEPCGLNCYVIIGDGMTVINNIEAMGIDNDTLHYNDNDQVAVNTGALYTAGNGILITEDPENSRFIISASIDNDTIIFNDQGQLCAPGSGGGIAELMENITWENLKQLRDNNSLVPGKQYRIIDYECTTTQEYTKSAKHQFDIIVTADSTNVLNENARAGKHDLIGGNIEITYIYKGDDTYNITDIYVYSGVSIINNIDYYTWFNSEHRIYIACLNNTPSSFNDCYIIDDDQLIPIQQYYYDNIPRVVGFDDFNFVTEDTYFSNSKLESWEIKYCLDNDTDRFAWAQVARPERNYIIVDDIYKFYEYDKTDNYIRWQLTTHQSYYAYTEPTVSAGDNLFEDPSLQTSVGKITELGTDPEIYAGTGVIYYMKDEFNNECSYDFKNILFARYNISSCSVNPKIIDTYAFIPDSSLYDVYPDLIKYMYTFTYMDEYKNIFDASLNGEYVTDVVMFGVYNNCIKDAEKLDGGYTSITKLLNNNVFVGDLMDGCVFANNILLSSNNNTFHNIARNNKIDAGCHYNYFGSRFAQNILGAGSTSNIFGMECIRNNFGIDFRCNSVGNNIEQLYSFGYIQYCDISNTSSGRIQNVHLLAHLQGTDASHLATIAFVDGLNATQVAYYASEADASGHIISVGKYSIL